MEVPRALPVGLHKDLTFLKIRGLLEAFFMLLKHGPWVQDVMLLTL